MEAVGGAALFAGASAVKDMGNYNRQNYLSNLKMIQSRRYHMQSLVLKQASMFRKDFRDLIGLSMARQHNFLIISTLMVNVVIRLYTGTYDSASGKGEAERLYHLCSGSSLVYLFASIIYMVWANYLASKCEREMLTSTVRLPIEGIKEELDLQLQEEQAESFERLDVSKLLRLPGLSRLVPGKAGATTAPLTGDAESRDDLSAKEQEASVDSMNRMRERNVQELSLREAEWDAMGTDSLIFAGLGMVHLLYAFTYRVLPACGNSTCLTAFMPIAVNFVLCKWGYAYAEATGIAPVEHAEHMTAFVARGWLAGFVGVAGPVAFIEEKTFTAVALAGAFFMHTLVNLWAFHRFYIILTSIPAVTASEDDSDEEASADIHKVGNEDLPPRRNHRAHGGIKEALTITAIIIFFWLAAFVLLWTPDAVAVQAGHELPTPRMGLIQAVLAENLDAKELEVFRDFMAEQTVLQDADAEELATFLYAQKIRSKDAMRNLSPDDLDMALRDPQLGMGTKAAVRQLYRFSRPESLKLATPHQPTGE